MLFAADLGNSSIRFGVFDGEGKLCFRSRVCTTVDRSEDEYAVLIDSLLHLHGAERKSVEGAILSSVVPGLTHKLEAAITSVFGVTPLSVGRGLHTGFHIRMDSPAEVGADLIANAAAVLKLCGAPAVILDFGTVTTISFVDASRTFSGGCILPGVAVSLSAMRSTAAQLPEVTLEAPSQTIGRNTADSIRSGLIFGSAAAADGMIDRMLSEMKLSEQEVHPVATGGLANLIVPQMRHKISVYPDLTLTGLYTLYQANRPGARR